MPRRCVLGCDPSEVTMHGFPDPNKFPERFKTWVQIAGGKLESAADYEYYQQKRMCDIHFLDKFKNRNNRLNALAVPTLHLPGLVMSRVNIDQASTSAPAQLTTSHPPSTGQVMSRVKIDQASTSAPAQLTTSQPPSTGALHSDKARVIKEEHNYSAISKPMKTSNKGITKEEPYCNLKLKSLGSKVKSLRLEITRLRKKGMSFKARLENAENLSNSETFQHLVKNMTKPSQLFFHMQLQSSKKPKGRRFSIEEKVLSLSLYKKSPKCYALLHKYFTLPSAKTMKRLLSQVKIIPGINPIVFKKIKNTMGEKVVADRLCSLIFDEMSLTPQIFYCSQKDAFEGFATNQPEKIADHALVFMVKGVKQNFKQPVAYYFTKGLNKNELREVIKTVIKHCQDSGLIVLNTVCDQSTVNVGAITDLVNDTKTSYLRHRKEWRNDLFCINGQKIIPLYDAPHLIKGIRNNLLTKDMVYTMHNKEQVVKWEYYQMVYTADKSYGELSLLDKLTEEHVNPEKISKMRVKSATQLFSHSVAVATEHLTARGSLPEECRQLIDITLLLDNLFDTMNANTFHIPNGKRFKGPVRKNSPHHQLWQDAKKVLKTIRFRHSKKIGDRIRLIETSVPSVNNFIKTIEGMEAIWKVMSAKYGFDAMLTRNFNQDPAENFFGNIRSYGARNISPNTVAFEGAFKALLLNNYNSPHSSRANCEEDSNKCLQTLDFFLTENHIASDAPLEESNDIQCNEDMFNMDYTKEMDAGQRNYVCGWVLTKCLKNITKSCNLCKQNLLDVHNTNTKNAFIRAKEYDSKKKWLCYPSEELENCFHDLQHKVTCVLKQNPPKTQVKKTILSLTDLLIDYPFECPIHKDDLKKYFTNVAVNVILHSWCRSINRILSGKLTYDGEDIIKNIAQQYYNKHKHFKNKK